MNNNIEKLYELANITCKDLDFCHDCCNFKENKCICKTELVYECLPFTPEKQLELIKWFGKNSIMKKVYDIYNREDFPQALAGLVCELWDDLTDKQREEIRGILR